MENGDNSTTLLWLFGFGPTCGLALTGIGNVRYDHRNRDTASTREMAHDLSSSFTHGGGISSPVEVILPR